MKLTKEQKSALKRAFVAMAGGLLLVVGILAIPYPGPGWLIVFAALALLSTEFEWARTMKVKLRARYDWWQHKIDSQPLSLRICLWVGTAVIMVLTIWLINGYGYLNDFFGLGMDWLRSPIPWF